MVERYIGYENGDSRNADGWYDNGGDAEGVALRAEAAGALDSLNFYYRQEFGRNIVANEGMRSIQMQWYYWNAYQEGWGNLAGWPGTSIHGWGLAVDLNWPLDTSGTTEHNWLVNHAPLFGWWHAGATFSQYEGWHFEYDGRNVSAEQAREYQLRGSKTKKEEKGFLMALSDDQQNALAVSVGKMEYAVQLLLNEAKENALDRWKRNNSPEDKRILENIDQLLKQDEIKLGVLSRLDKARWAQMNELRNRLLREITADLESRGVSGAQEVAARAVEKATVGL